MRKKFVQVVSWFLVLALLLPSAGYTVGAEYETRENTAADPGVTEEIVDTPGDSEEVTEEPEETPEDPGDTSGETEENPEGSGDTSGETEENTEGSGDTSGETEGNTEGSGDTSGETEGNPEGSGDTSGETEGKPEGSGDASSETGENPEGSGDTSGETGENPEDPGDTSGETGENPEDPGDTSGEAGENPEGSGDDSGETGDNSGDSGESGGETGGDLFPPEEPPVQEEPPVEEEPSMSEKLVRIGIYYGTAGKESVSLSISTGSGYHFGFYDSGDDNRFIPISSTERKKITVTAEQGTMVVTDTSSGTELYRHDFDYGSQLGILPYSDSGEKTVTKCGYNYYGGFRFERMDAYDGTMTIVNMVPLDDYVKGVVPYEMSPSWHLEALKVQSVCARTFTLSHLNGKHRKTFSFDLCDSDCCQVYKGVYTKSYASVVEEAVDATAGVVLMYDGEYCDTVYSSSNGGSSESAKNVWGKDVPYLQGTYDPYEAYIADRITKYAWSVTFTSEELQQKLIAGGYVNCGLIKEVKTTLSDTENVIALTFVDENDKSYSIYNGTKCRTFLSLRSIHYTVTMENGADTNDASILVNDSETLNLADGLTVITGDGTVSTITEGYYIITPDGVEELKSGPSVTPDGTKFTFSGTGWGHNVGMSQYGAYAMAEIGYTYDEILEFYYTGAMIVQC